MPQAGRPLRHTRCATFAVPHLESVGIGPSTGVDRPEGSTVVSFDLKKMFRVPTPAERIAGLALRPDLARAAVRMVADERSDAEVKELNAALLGSESVIALVEGRCERHLGLLALTTQRLLFRAHGSARGDLLHYPLTEVVSVQDRLGSVTSRLELQISRLTLVVDKILGAQAREFAVAIRSQLVAPGPLTAPDPVAEMIELRARRDAGTIGTQEFDAAKARLLDEL